MDFHRPAYHFRPRANWMNDPNGLIQWKGVYHMYYQYNPAAAKHGKIHWGHATSRDLVHWQHRPVALTPSPEGPDAEGCWSGCAVPQSGRPVFLYTGWANGQQTTCLAKATDDSLDHLLPYASNPVIAQPPITPLEGFRDHTVWREAGASPAWLMAIGSGIPEKHGLALVYRSPDLVNWQYIGPLTDNQTSQRFPLYSGDMWECPSFFELNGKHVLMISIVGEKHAWYTAAYVGSYSPYRFSPVSFEKVDYGDLCFYAPQTFLDEHGRRIMFGWITETRPEKQQLADGWSGVMSLPRRLSVDRDGNLQQEFLAELEQLRHTGVHLERWELTPQNPLRLDEHAGNQLEIRIELEASGAGQATLACLRTPDGQEETRLVVDWENRQLILDRSSSSLDGDVDHSERRGPLPEPLQGAIQLHIYLDHSVIECIANQRTTLTGRMYPTRADSCGLVLSAPQGRTMLRSLDIWKVG